MKRRKKGQERVREQEGERGRGRKREDMQDICMCV